MREGVVYYGHLLLMMMRGVKRNEGVVEVVERIEVVNGRLDGSSGM
jgi:hypothetical protein